MDVQRAGRVFVDPGAYADEGRLHEAFGVLRRESPVHWVVAEGFNPVWAITRHADVAAIEPNVAVFRNEPRPLLLPAMADERPAPLRTLIHMDAPDHTALRGLTALGFAVTGLVLLAACGGGNSEPVSSVTPTVTAEASPAGSATPPSPRAASPRASGSISR